MTPIGIAFAMANGAIFFIAAMAVIAVNRLTDIRDELRRQRR